MMGIGEGVSPENLVSVIIPCFHQAHFLGDAIRSVFSQTHVPREIVVVDDGSPDNVAGIVSNFPGVKYVHQKNSGLSVARNTGLSLSTGNYLVFLDADDRLLPDALESHLSCLEDHPDCAFVSGQVKFIGPDGEQLQTPHEPLIESNHYLVLLKYCYIWTAGAVMFRKSVFQNETRFAASLLSTGDWDLYLRVSRTFPVHCHPAVVAEHRRHSGNMTQNPTLLLKDSLATLHGQWKYVKGNGVLEDALQTGIHGAQRYYGEPLADEIQKNLEAGNWMLALQGVMNILRYYPAGFRKYFYSRFFRSAFKRSGV